MVFSVEFAYIFIRTLGNKIFFSLSIEDSEVLRATMQLSLELEKLLKEQ